MYCRNCGTYNADTSKYCNSCGKPLTEYSAPARQTNTAFRNFFMGILGALLGAVAGGAIIILFSRLGVVAAAAGALLAALVVLGYNKLGNGITIPGFLVCVVIIAVTPYLADRLDWAFLVMDAFEEYTLVEAFKDVPYFIEQGAIESDVYKENLLKLYGFTGLGIVSMLFSVFKK